MTLRCHYFLVAGLFAASCADTDPPVTRSFAVQGAGGTPAPAGATGTGAAGGAGADAGAAGLAGATKNPGGSSGAGSGGQTGGTGGGGAGATASGGCSFGAAPQMLAISDSPRGLVVDPSAIYVAAADGIGRYAQDGTPLLTPIPKSAGCQSGMATSGTYFYFANPFLSRFDPQTGQTTVWMDQPLDPTTPIAIRPGTSADGLGVTRGGYPYEMTITPPASGGDASGGFCHQQPVHATQISAGGLLKFVFLSSVPTSMFVEAYGCLFFQSVDIKERGDLLATVGKATFVGDIEHGTITKHDCAPDNPTCSDAYAVNSVILNEALLVLAADAGGLYWIRSSSSPCAPYELRTSDLAGNGARTIALVASKPTALALDGTYAYWTQESGEVMRAARLLR